MSHPNLKADTICQVGIIVHDIERTARKYCEVFGFEMPQIVETAGYAQSKTTYNGQPSEATAKLAFFNAGQITIELIEPDDQPSVWREFLEQHGEGIHHIAFQVKDTEAVTGFLAEHDAGIAQQGLYSDGSGVYTYVDTAPLLGTMFELLESFPRS